MGDKYQGRLLRVANALAENMAAPGAPQPPVQAMSSTAPAPAPPPVVAAAPAAPAAPASAAKAIDKQAVSAKFQELVKSGMDPNEAAMQAIKIVRAEAANAVPSTG